MSERANPLKDGDAKPWVYHPALRTGENIRHKWDQDRQVAEDEPFLTLREPGD